MLISDILGEAVSPYSYASDFAMPGRRGASSGVAGVNLKNVPGTNIKRGNIEQQFGPGSGDVVKVGIDTKQGPVKSMTGYQDKTGGYGGGQMKVAGGDFKGKLKTAYNVKTGQDDIEIDATKGKSGIKYKQDAQGKEKLLKMGEAATAGATASGNIAAVANPAIANQKIKRDKNGIPVAPQKKNPNGTVKNALDMKNNIMGTVVKR